MSREPDTPIFYPLPAHKLTPGLSTDDGQDILDVSQTAASVFVEVYTPRPDVPHKDEANRLTAETRMYNPDDAVDLAVFADTEVDGRSLTD